jgi:hypothetical protein
MATLDRPAPPDSARAAAAVLESEIAASLEGETTFPDGTAFVPRDLADPFMLEVYRREGTPVAIVADDGSVELLRQSPLEREDVKLALLALGAAIVLLLLSRRSAAVR